MYSCYPAGCSKRLYPAGKTRSSDPGPDHRCHNRSPDNRETTVPPTTIVTTVVPTTAAPVANVTAVVTTVTATTTTQRQWSPPQRRSPSIYIRNNTFVPQELTVLPGTGITWINDDRTIHAIKTIPQSRRSCSIQEMLCQQHRTGIPSPRMKGTYGFIDPYTNATGIIIIKKGDSIRRCTNPANPGTNRNNSIKSPIILFFNRQNDFLKLLTVFFVSSVRFTGLRSHFS